MGGFEGGWLERTVMGIEEDGWARNVEGINGWMSGGEIPFTSWHESVFERTAISGPRVSFAFPLTKKHGGYFCREIAFSTEYTDVLLDLSGQ